MCARAREERTQSEPVLPFDPSLGVEVSMAFSGKAFTVSYAGQEETVSYSSVVRCLEFDDGILILTKKQTMVFLPVLKDDDANCDLLDICMLLRARFSWKYDKKSELELPDFEPLEDLDPQQSPRGVMLGKISVKISMIDYYFHTVWQYLFVQLIAVMGLYMFLQTIWNPQDRMFFILAGMGCLLLPYLLDACFLFKMREFYEKQMTVILYENALIFRSNGGEWDCDLNWNVKCFRFFTVNIVRIRGMSEIIPARELKREPAFAEALRKRLSQ